MTQHELFKEAVTDYMVNDMQVQRACKAHKKHRIAQKAAMAAACLLFITAITVCTIPNARAAVSEWLRGWFRAGDYFRQDSESRRKEPTIEAIITDAAESEIVITAVGAGHKDYAAVFTLTLDEIAYDGNHIFITGAMPGAAARPFVQARTGGDTFRCAKYDGSLGDDPDSEYYFFACENYVEFTADDGTVFDGEIVPSFTDAMRDIASLKIYVGVQPVFENGVLLTSNPVTDRLWDKYLSDHSIRFTIELYPSFPNTPQLSGTVDGELSLRMWYDNVDSRKPEEMLHATLGSISIDAEAYRTQTAHSAIGTTVQLGGVHPVTVQEWQPVAERTSDDCKVYLYTRELDFSGASCTLKEISFTPTDTKLKLHVVLPESWTEAERCAGNALCFRFLLDGEDMQNKEIESPFDPAEHTTLGRLFSAYGPEAADDASNDWIEYDYVLFNSVIPPSKWAEAKTLTIIPATEYWWEMLVWYDNGPKKPFSLRDGAIHTGTANHTGYECDRLYDAMSPYAITVHLDDYR